MVIHKNFIRFASVCCFITVITTLGIHAFFPDPPAGFEERILLFRNTTYLVNRWWVIVHCLLVIVAMWGFALLMFKRMPGLTGLGFLFFCVFGIAEITRQMMVLFYTNVLREQYYTATDAVIKEGSKIRPCKRWAAYCTAIRRVYSYVWFRQSLLRIKFDQNQRVQQTAFHYVHHLGHCELYSAGQ